MYIMVEILNRIPSQQFDKLFYLLNQINIPRTNHANNRRGFPMHEKLNFGLSKGRFNGVVGLSRQSILYPDIFEEIINIGDAYCPFQYTSIHLNHNVTCPPHKDLNNKINSFIVSFGEYEGGKLVIEGETFDTLYRPVIFNGSELEHWNTNDLVGNKYSLVLYIL